VDISEPSFGVALLNDSKYGCSVRDGVIGLSLLKAPKFPDHEADMGVHRFVYSLLPHEQSMAPVFEEAQRLNTPLWVAVVEPKAQAVREEYPVACELFNNSQFIQVLSKNVQVGAFKQSEESADTFILRLHEDRGDRVTAKVKFCFGLAPHAIARPVKGVNLVNTLEEPVEGEELAFNEERQEVVLTLRPYKILTLALHF